MRVEAVTDLDQDVAEIRSVVRQWGEKAVRPRIQELEARGEFPRALYREMGELGFFGCCFPESMGGTQTGFRALAAVAEELARAYPPLSAGMNLQAATVPLTIANWGTPTAAGTRARSEEHTSELHSPDHLLCRLLLEKKKS